MIVSRRLASSSSSLLHQSWRSGGGASALQARHVKKLLQVILTEPVDRLGEAGDIVKVSAGYARNYLCPQLKAMPAIEKYVNLVKQNLKFFPPTVAKEDEEQAERQKQDKIQRRDIERMLHRFDTRGLVLYKIIKDPTTLRFPVTARDLVPEVARQLQIEVVERHFDLPEPLTQLGHFQVPIRLPPDLPLPGGKRTMFLKVRIRRKNYLHDRVYLPPKYPNGAPPSKKPKD
ncbi:hypothetical protein SELMODRAFT_447126 [Selaginella moellendorffii]|uniref:Large ribosomal subunit protein bL9c n=1 Tax=Selaginella moellendorffii TaxID=88036 RepID=D8SWY0_SELML|nr:uncharacterized protein LOC9651937 [Selaginella moellendorffii]XP_024520004.1 uncharacterized protein LOC112342433 [Selaginella moellendorffii]EFJ11102.1 hypothetical protein SELMODRAFT_447126 [Selaginella moellendorffii]|eukprot:XP_002987799.1 uncharacterized protein LOC9651937 [Selaginella moellendorffii]